MDEVTWLNEWGGRVDEVQVVNVSKLKQCLIHRLNLLWGSVLVVSRWKCKLQMRATVLIQNDGRIVLIQADELANSQSPFVTVRNRKFLLYLKMLKCFGYVVIFKLLLFLISHLLVWLSFSPRLSLVDLYMIMLVPGTVLRLTETPHNVAILYKRQKLLHYERLAMPILCVRVISGHYHSSATALLSDLHRLRFGHVNVTSNGVLSRI